MDEHDDGCTCYPCRGRRITDPKAAAWVLTQEGFLRWARGRTVYARHFKGSRTEAQLAEAQAIAGGSR
ncbi:MAG: hypothetical protein A2Y74_05640 [Actinobacteria bacterium RBG_13_63_9]|nr:MAG: hypothetical protein A2Y74_05640 [Actinobacteria bacterium RBG_13_63_9]